MLTPTREYAHSTVTLDLVKECSIMTRFRVSSRSVSEVERRVGIPNTTWSSTHMLHQIKVYLRETTWLTRDYHVTVM